MSLKVKSARLSPVSPNKYAARTRYIYAAQLDPQNHPGVVKLGESTGVAQRKNAFRTTHPRVEIVGAWETDLDESTVLKNAAFEADRQNHSNGRCEVFHTDDPAGFVQWLDTFITNE